MTFIDKVIEKIITNLIILSQRKNFIQNVFIKSKKILLKYKEIIFLSLFVIIIIIYSYISVKVNKKKLEDHGYKDTAIIVNTEFATHGTIVKFKFYVNGIWFDGVETIHRSDFNVGDRTIIIYLPENPEVNSLVKDSLNNYIIIND
jgi:hypothetical protein